MNKIHISSKVEFGQKINVGGDVATEQMVRAMSFDAMRSHFSTSPITEVSLAGIDKHWWDNRKFWSIDSRVHMLMKDWWPCIPGWHHDDVQRTREDGQPNYDDGLRCEHAVFLVNAQVAPTLFAVGNLDYDIPPLGETIYEKWSEQVDMDIVRGDLEVVECPDRQWVYFNDRTWHCGNRAKVDFGHRLFIRIGMHYREVMGEKVYVPPPKWNNEIRRNAQVYLDMPMKGW